MLPNGLVAVNDDARHRVVVIDPKTNAIVWQYGHTDVAGSSAGYLTRPDGMDFLPYESRSRCRGFAHTSSAVSGRPPGLLKLPRDDPRMEVHADVAQLVEHHLAKVGVAGSNPVVRSRDPQVNSFGPPAAS